MAVTSTTLPTEIPMDTRRLVVVDDSVGVSLIDNSVGVSVGVEAEQVIIRLYKNNVLNKN